MNALIIVLLIIILIAVAAVGVLMTRGRDDRRELDTLREYIKGLDDSNRRNIDLLRQSHSAEIQMLSERHEKQVEALSRQWRERLEELDRQSALTFQALSRQALDGSVEMLKTGNSELLDPLRRQLESLSQLVHRVEVDSTASRQTLTERIDQLARLNQSIGEEARELSKALRGNSKVQGDWGETILKTLLENAGLQEGINFRYQPGSEEDGAAYRSETGAALRPDFIVELPEGRRVIIDSKVSLTDYLKYCESEDEASRREAAKRHLNSVKKHIDELKTKRYQKAVPGAMDHVLMFIPNEGAYLAVMTIDPQIWRYAYEHQVVMVTAPHLLTAIQIIGQLWRQERQDRNASEIARIAGLLYDSYVDLLARMQKVGTAIDNTHRSYDDVCNMLSDRQPKSLTRRAMKLRELGAKTSKRIPEEPN